MGGGELPELISQSEIKTDIDLFVIPVLFHFIFFTLLYLFTQMSHWLFMFHVQLDYIIFTHYCKPKFKL